MINITAKSQKSHLCKMIVWLTCLIITNSIFAGCLGNDDNDKEDDPIVPDPDPDPVNESFIKKIAGPFTYNDENYDQVLVGGYTNEDGELLYIYFEEGDSIYSYNNNTKSKKPIFADSEIRGWDLCGRDLFVYSSHNGSGGSGSPQKIHEVNHINLENGSSETFHSTAAYGPTRERDYYIIVGSTGPINNDNETFGLVYFRDPDDGDANQDPMTWDLFWANQDHNEKYLEQNVPLDELLAGDAVGRKSTGYVGDTGNFGLFRFNPDISDFEKVLELEDVKDFSLSDDDNNLAVIIDDELYISTVDDPDNRTKITAGAAEVDINGHILMVTKDDGTYLINEKIDETAKIYDESITNPWLEGFEYLFHPMGSVYANTYYLAHFDITLSI